MRQAIAELCAARYKATIVAGFHMRVPSDHDSDDPWVLLPSRVATAHLESESTALQVEIIKGVEPLDTQIGVFPKKTVPDALYDALFGESAPTAAEIKAAGGDPALVPPMQPMLFWMAPRSPTCPNCWSAATLSIAVCSRVGPMTN